MQASSFQQLPPFYFWLAVVWAGVVAVLQIGLLGFAYKRLGISRGAAYLILLLSLLGAAVNIPFAEIGRSEVVERELAYDYWGVPYVKQTMTAWPGTVLAINVGGAVIPTLLSIYLVIKNQIYGLAALGIAIVSVVMYWLAEPIPQMGISVPLFVPPIVAAVVAISLSREHAGALAYICGCVGTLVGADLLNLGEISRLGTSMASIGGAGTFDAVFLTGILAVLLAGSRGIAERWRVAEKLPIAAE